MTSAEELVASVRASGVDLLVVGGRIRVEGPRGVLTPARRAELASHRDAVLALLIAESDAAALDRLDAALGDDGPPSRRGGTEDTDDPDLAQHVANALALSQQERTAWRHEIVHALVWTEAGRGQDPHLAADLRAPRRMVPPGRCLRCGAQCHADGRDWCDRCSSEYPKSTEVTP